MVLSNKKLKQKLRDELLSQNENNSNDAPSSSNSLKTLIDSAAHNPRLSKREKRRKIRSLQHPQAENAPEGADEAEAMKKESGSGSLGNKKNKKRKRKEKEDVEEPDGVGYGVVKDDDKSMNKKKKQKKKKKKKKKTKTVEENGSKLEGELPESTETTKSNTTISQENGDVHVPTKVYVGGIPYYSSEDDIRSYFEGCGTITEIDCMTFPESGKFRGIAIISFKTEAAAQRALALDGSDMGGLFLKIQPYKAARATKAPDFAPEIQEGYNRIYVGSLSWDITEEELRKFFSNCQITSIRFGMDKETGEFRGYAHVDFSDGQSLKTALTLDQKILCGRPVRISCAVPLKKKQPGVQKSSVVPPTTSNGGVVVEKSSSTASGKKRRRLCFLCSEKGHVADECPKNKTTVTPTTT